MKKYALIQPPISEMEFSAQITIVDTSTHEGGKRKLKTCAAMAICMSAGSRAITALNN